LKRGVPSNCSKKAQTRGFKRMGTESGGGSDWKKRRTKPERFRNGEWAEGFPTREELKRHRRVGEGTQRYYRDRGKR